MTGLYLNPLLVDVAQRRVEAACETLAEETAEKMAPLCKRWGALRAARDSNGRTDIAEGCEVLRAMLKAGNELVENVIREAWPALALLVPPMLQGALRARLVAAFREVARKPVAALFGGWDLERFDSFMAEAHQYDRETAAQARALLADIFKETTTCH